MKQFFFNKRLTRILQREIIPQRQVFQGELQQRIARILQKENLISSSLFTHHPFRFMKLHKFSFGVIPVVLAIAVFGIIEFGSWPHTKNGIYINQVLAKSIDNTFYPNNSTEFRYQEISGFMGKVSIWQQGNNVRFDLLTGSTLYSAVDNQSCRVDYQQEKTTSVKDVNLLFECSDGFDMGTAKLLMNGTTLALNNVHAQHLDDPRGDLSITWTTAESINDENIQMSTGASGFIDSISVVNSWVDAEGKYQHQVSLNISDMRYNAHRENTSDHLFQIVSGDRSSAVYAVNIDTIQVRTVSNEELETFREEYKKTVQKDFLGRAIENIYETQFMDPLSIRQRIDELGEPVSQEKEQYLGKEIIRVRYQLSNVFFNEEESLPDPAVEFVINTTDDTILEYTMYRDNQVVSHATVDEQKNITDIPPDDFFSVDYWKDEIQPQYLQQ
ncbi:MAG: hypothetical protein HYV32_06120 [Candidatus Kerfeldbacteria bacterium]|nr:hypothetical protein [Candidatus Kerfeldbacteria bacterium]